MEDKTKQFLRKVRFDTYIYTATFIVLSLSYFMLYDLDSAPVLLLLAAFVFYTLGKQIRLVGEIEAGAEINTRPRAPLWVRLSTYAVIIFMMYRVFFM